MGRRTKTPPFVPFVPGLARCPPPTRGAFCPGETLWGCPLRPRKGASRREIPRMSGRAVPVGWCPPPRQGPPERDHRKSGPGNRPFGGDISPVHHGAYTALRIGTAPATAVQKGSGFCPPHREGQKPGHLFLQLGHALVQGFQLRVHRTELLFQIALVRRKFFQTFEKAVNFHTFFGGF